MNPHALTPTNYAAALYQILLQLEERGIPKTEAYTDGKGIPTIGVGINIQVPSHLRDILEVAYGLPKSDASLLAEQLSNATQSKWDPNLKGAAAAPLRSALNKVMADYKMTHPEAPATFSLTVDQIKDVFNRLVPDFEAYVNSFLNRFGVADLGESLEKLALVSLGWNDSPNIPNKLLNTGLGKALAKGDRATAWYEIRYNSNGGIDKEGVAKRRYIEAYLFGLYDADKATADEARQTYQMLSKGNNRAKIINDETQFGVPPNSTSGSARSLQLARGDYKALIDGMNAALPGSGDSLPKDPVPTLLESLTPAYNAFLEYANSLRGADAPDIDKTVFSNAAAIYFLGEDASDKTLDARADDARSGNRLNNNLLVGGAGKDTLYGGGGRDYLIGGRGNDTLDGGKDNDILIGGEGFDTYIWKTGDGDDKIIDSDLKGRIVINGVAEDIVPRTFIKVSDGEWVSADGNLRLTHHSPWQIITGDGSSIQLGDNFADGGFGIQLEDYTATPTIVRTILGDLEPVGGFDDLGNPLTAGDAPDRPDTLNGSTGNDLIQSKGGDDSVVANDGDDVVEAGSGRDIVSGGAGNDIISGNAGADILYGGAGNDQIYADAKIDTAVAITQTQSGAAGRELLIGGAGDDLLIGDGTSDVLMGGANDDLLIGGAGRTKGARLDYFHVRKHIEPAPLLFTDTTAA